MRLKRVSEDDPEQALFEKAVAETGHWQKCPSCSHMYYFVAGYVEQCEKCGQRQQEEAAG